MEDGRVILYGVFDIQNLPNPFVKEERVLQRDQIKHFSVCIDGIEVDTGHIPISNPELSQDEMDFGSWL